MVDPAAFMSIPRENHPARPVEERIGDSFEIALPLPDERLRRQASRCMDCGIPFCHGTGCPVSNRIPEFNRLVHRRRWRDASENLHQTNNFPEITGRICPAPCEAACTLAINDDAVSIKQIELQVAEYAFANGWVTPQIAATESGRRVAVVGSGPAGLAAAQQLARSGHEVVVFEKNARPGGLLRYGIPDFKLAKSVLDRRLEQLEAEGVQFRGGVTAGVDISPRYLEKMFDATLLAIGAGRPRDLVVPGRAYENVFFAMQYLTRQNRLIAGEIDESSQPVIDAKDRIAVVIGGGDTGADCVGTAIRQGAREVHQLEILPEPPRENNPATPWPTWPDILRTGSSHEEGCRRQWSVQAQRLSGTGVEVNAIHGCEVDWSFGPDGPVMSERPATEFEMPVDLVLLAMGFEHADHEGLVTAMDIELDHNGNLLVDGSFQTTKPGVFAAGDASTGASLVVHAICNGRLAAAAIDERLR